MLSDNTTDLVNSGRVTFPENHDDSLGLVADLFGAQSLLVTANSHLLSVEQTSHWDEIHQYIYTTQKEAESKFHSWWDRRPRNCSCRDAEALLNANPIDFTSAEAFFGTCVRLHNAVNAKMDLDRPGVYPQMPLAMAKLQWRPDLLDQQPKIDLVAVTSLSPLQGHQEVQRKALASWRKLGLDVVSVNLTGELKDLRSSYPDVKFVKGRATKHFNRPVPQINSLVDQGLEKPIVLLNSDCRLFGDQSLLKTPSVGIRHNWKRSILSAEREQWGLDMFVLTPELARTVPRLPFGIGQPMWDYWLAWHLQRHCDLLWIGEQLIYHEAHPINWNQDHCEIGRKWITEHYGVKVDWGEWRLQQPYTYSKLDLSWFTRLS